MKWTCDQYGWYMVPVGIKIIYLKPDGADRGMRLYSNINGNFYFYDHYGGTKRMTVIAIPLYLVKHLHLIYIDTNKW